MSSMENKIDKIVEKILEDYKDERFINKVEVFDQPDKEVVIDITKKMLKIIFPGFYRENNYHFYNNYSRLTNLLEDVMYNLNKQIAIALKQKPENKLRQQCEIQKDAENLSLAFFEQIPKIREYVDTDVQADFDGDPAAFNKKIASDVVAKDQRLDRIVLEVQHVEDETFNGRLVYYAAKHTIANLVRGQHFQFFLFYYIDNGKRF